MRNDEKKTEKATKVDSIVFSSQKEHVCAFIIIIIGFVCIFLKVDYALIVHRKLCAPHFKVHIHLR